MSNEHRLGKVVSGEEGRDAVHVAIVPVTAMEELQPGDHVGFPNGQCTHVSKMCFKKVGIVDPFLTETISKGAIIWLLIYPRQVTSLTHHWTHPAFGDGDGAVVEFVPEGLVK